MKIFTKELINTFISMYDYCADTGLLTRKIDWYGFKKGETVGSRKSNGYIALNCKGSTYYAHRVAWAIYFGKNPDGEIDHINHDRSDNRIINLRVVSAAENSRNQKIKMSNQSGQMGVWWCSANKSWVAEGVLNYKKHSLGSYPSKDDAISARLRWESDCGFHKNHGKRI